MYEKNKERYEKELASYHALTTDEAAVADGEPPSSAAAMDSSEVQPESGSAPSSLNPSQSVQTWNKLWLWILFDDEDVTVDAFEGVLEKTT